MHVVQHPHCSYCKVTSPCIAVYPVKTTLFLLLADNGHIKSKICVFKKKRGGGAEGNCSIHVATPDEETKQILFRFFSNYTSD